MLAWRSTFEQLEVLEDSGIESDGSHDGVVASRRDDFGYVVVYLKDSKHCSFMQRSEVLTIFCEQHEARIMIYK